MNYLETLLLLLLSLIPPSPELTQTGTLEGPIARPRKTVMVPVKQPVLGTFRGRASYYWEPQQTAWWRPPSGYERFRRYRPHQEPVHTAAHKSLPLGSLVRVVRTDRPGLQDTVLITDRGPYVAGRVVDLCLKSAHVLQMTRAGVVPVQCEVLRRGVP